MHSGYTKVTATTVAAVTETMVMNLMGFEAPPMKIVGNMVSCKLMVLKETLNRHGIASKFLDTSLATRDNMSGIKQLFDLALQKRTVFILNDDGVQHHMDAEIASCASEFIRDGGKLICLRTDNSL